MSENREEMKTKPSEQQGDTPKAATNSKSGKGKKRKRARIAVPAALGIICLALALGVIVGFLLGRGTLSRQLEDAKAQVLDLQARLGMIMDDTTAPYDEYDEALNARNAAALSELSDAGDEGGVLASDLVGEPGFAGAAQDAAAAVVVAEYSGGKLMSDEVSIAYSERFADAMFDGYSAQDIGGELLSSVMHDMIGERVTMAHAREMGLDKLSAEDEAELAAVAEADFAQYLNMAKSMLDVSGLSEQEADGAAKAYLMENGGITLDSIKAQYAEHWWHYKLYDELTKDVQIDETALKSAYKQELEQQKHDFTQTPGEFEYAQLNGELVLYKLPGYRRIQVLQFSFGSLDDIAQVELITEQLKDANDEQKKALNAQLDAIYANVDARANDAVAQLASGADFDMLLQTKGDDFGMRDAALRSEGYYISATTSIWDAPMREAAMKLTQTGEISAPVRCIDGVYILRYLGDVPEGAVELNSLHDRFLEQTLEDKKQETYNSRVEAWIEAAKPVYYPERMQ